MTLAETRQLRALLASRTRQVEEGGIAAVFRGGTPANGFHAQIAQGSRNPWLAQMICPDLFPPLRLCRYRSAVLEPRRHEVPNEHLGILEAIERRDPDEAERLMRVHIAAGREHLPAETRARMPG